MSKSTPRPWRLDEDFDEHIIGANNEGVADCCVVLPKIGPRHAENEANAALIVRAVNAHDDLVAALNDAPILSKYHGQHGFDVERFILDYEKWSANRWPVLAKAGEP